MSWLLNVFKSGGARMPSEKALQLVKDTTAKHKVNVWGLARALLRSGPPLYCAIASRMCLSRTAACGVARQRNAGGAAPRGW